jgi:hypothetical protein
MKELNGFLETMERELELTIGAIESIKDVRAKNGEEFTNGDYKVITDLLKLKEQQEKTIKYIKEYKRGLIG